MPDSHRKMSFSALIHDEEWESSGRNAENGDGRDCLSRLYFALNRIQGALQIDKKKRETSVFLECLKSPKKKKKKKKKKIRDKKKKEENDMCTRWWRKTMKQDKIK